MVINTKADTPMTFLRISLLALSVALVSFAAPARAATLSSAINVSVTVVDTCTVAVQSAAHVNSACDRGTAASVAVAHTTQAAFAGTVASTTDAALTVVTVTY